MDDWINEAFKNAGLETGRNMMHKAIFKMFDGFKEQGYTPTEVLACATGFIKTTYPNLLDLMNVWFIEWSKLNVS